MRIQKILVIILVAFLLFTFLPETITTKASPTTTLYFEPTNIIDPSITIGTNLTFLIKVGNVTDLYAWQVKLYFNPTLLNWTGADYPPGHVFQGKNFQPITPIKDTDAGGTYILFFATLIGAASTFSGSGSLCRMNFTVLQQGSSYLRFSRPLGEDTWLWNSNLDPIEFEALDPPPPPPPVQPAALYVDPPKKIDPMLVACNNFTVNINIKNATALRQVELKLGFNSTLLNVVKATLGSFLPPATIYTIEINNTQGYVAYSAKVNPPEPSLNGNGTLAQITLHVESLGFCNLTLFETSLIDDYGRPIPHSTRDGYFNNLMLAKIAVQPPEIINPTLLPPQTFEINITIAEVEDLYGYAFKLRYDPAILIALQVTIHEVFGEVYYIPNFSIDNTHGIVQVSVTYVNPANPISTTLPITLVTLKFRVWGRGITLLDLYDTSLTDSSGHPITHEARDGLFANARRDIAVIDVGRDITEAYQGWIVNINVTARNEGDLNETFNVKVYYGTSGYVGTLTFTNVDPNETVTETIPWNTKDVPACQNYTVWAEAVPLPYETNLANNKFTDGAVKIWLMGDVNHDRKVDGRDIALAALAFGTSPGHPRWNPTVDVNRDNKIDGKDLAKIASNFGKKC